MKKFCALLLCAVLLSGTVGNYIYPNTSIDEVQASVAISPEIVGAFSQWLYSLFLSADIVEYSSNWNERYVDMERVMLSSDVYDYAQYCEIVEIFGGVSLSYEDYIAYLNEHIYGADYVSGSGALQITEEGQRVLEVLEGGGGSSEPDNNEKPPSFQVSMGLIAMACSLLGAEGMLPDDVSSEMFQNALKISDALKSNKMKYNFTVTHEMDGSAGGIVTNWNYSLVPRFNGLPENENFMFHMEFIRGVDERSYIQQYALTSENCVPIVLMFPYTSDSYSVCPVIVKLENGNPVSWSNNSWELNTYYMGYEDCNFGNLNTNNTKRTSWISKKTDCFHADGSRITIVGYSYLFDINIEHEFVFDTDWGVIISSDLNSALARLDKYVLENDPTVFDNFSGYYALETDKSSAFAGLSDESLTDWTDALSQPFADGSLLIDGAEDIASLQDVTVDTLPEIYPEIYPEYQPDVDFSQYPEIYPDYDPVTNPNPVPAVEPDPERVVENVVENVIVPDGAVEPLPDVNPDIEPDVESDILDTGNLAGVTFSLSDYFPFCIPFDLIDAVRLLASKEAVAPRWEWTLDVDLFGYGVHHTFVLDMSQFEDLARVMRVFETLFFVVGLIVITRNIIRG